MSDFKQVFRLKALDGNKAVQVHNFLTTLKNKIDMKTIKIDFSTLGDEITNAIKNNSKKSAERWNKKQDLKYYKYCLKTWGKDDVITIKAKKDYEQNTGN